MDVLDGERGSGALLLRPRCWHIGAAQAVLGSDRWPIPCEAGLPGSLAAKLGSLLQVEGCCGLLQVFVPAFSLWLPFKGENRLKNRKPEALLKLGSVARGERELHSLSGD